MQTAHSLVLALGLAALSASSSAQTTVYTSSASFLANVAPGAYTETFNGLPSAPPASFSGGGFAYTVSAPGDLYGSGEFLGTSLPDEALTVTFTSGNVTAVGGNFYATNISDAFQSVAITLTLSDSTTVTFTPTSAADSYRGFASSLTITSLTIGSPGVSLYAGVDNLTVGVSAVPEPASALLMALGVAALLVGSRRRA
jgi:PEP-CTERM motif